MTIPDLIALLKDIKSKGEDNHNGTITPIKLYYSGIVDTCNVLLKRLED